MRAFLVTLYVLILVLLFMIWASQNDSIVSINFIFWDKVSVPLSLALATTFASGLVIGGLFAGFVGLRYRLSNKHLVNKLKQRDEEVKNLRALPLKDSY